ARRLHLRKIDHDAIIAQGVARDVMAAASDGESNLAVPRKVHCLDDVRGTRAADDRRGPSVDRRAPDLAPALIAIRGREQSLSTISALQLVYIRGWLLLQDSLPRYIPYCSLLIDLYFEDDIGHCADAAITLR